QVELGQERPGDFVHAADFGLDVGLVVMLGHGDDMTQGHSALRVSEGRAPFDPTRPIRIDSLRSISKSGGQSPSSSSPSFSSLATSFLACASDEPSSWLAIVAG